MPEVSLRLNHTGSVNLLASRGTLSAVLELHQKRTTPNRTVTLHLPADPRRKPAQRWLQGIVVALSSADSVSRWPFRMRTRGICWYEIV